MSPFISGARKLLKRQRGLNAGSLVLPIVPSFLVLKIDGALGHLGGSVR